MKHKLNRTRKQVIKCSHCHGAFIPLEVLATALWSTWISFTFDCSTVATTQRNHYLELDIFSFCARHLRVSSKRVSICAPEQRFESLTAQKLGSSCTAIVNNSSSKWTLKELKNICEISIIKFHENPFTSSEAFQCMPTDPQTFS